jgi:hypothetical protein
VGVFVKAGGTSRYEVGEHDEARSGQSWSSNKHNQRSSGVDRPHGSAALR